MLSVFMDQNSSLSIGWLQIALVAIKSVIQWKQERSEWETAQLWNWVSSSKTWTWAKGTCSLNTLWLLWELNNNISSTRPQQLNVPSFSSMKKSEPWPWIHHSDTGKWISSGDRELRPQQWQEVHRLTASAAVLWFLSLLSFPTTVWFA